MVTGANQALVDSHVPNIHAIRTTIAGAFVAPEITDAITATYPDAVTEVYKFRSGGASGTVLSTVTVTYTDSTKASLSSVVRT